jgi:MFS family permease
MSFTNALQPGWRDVRLVALAAVLLYTSEFLVATTLLLRLHDNGASGAVVAGLMLATAVPMVLAAPFAGALVDRADSRWLLVGAGAAQVLVCAALTWADATALVLALVAVLAVCFAVVSPTLSALVPTMVDAQSLPKANSLVASANTVGLILGPVLGGLLTGAYGSRTPVLVATVLYGVTAAATLLFRTRRGAAVVGERRPTGGGGFLTGARLLLADPMMTAQLAMTTVVALLLQVTNVAEVFLVRDTLGASATLFGAVGTCWMVGMFAGAWAVGLGARDDGGLLRWGLTAAGLQAVTLTCVAVAPSVWWLMPLFAAGGFGNGVSNVARQTTFGRRAPAHARGRIFSVSAAVGNLGSVVALGVGGVVVSLAAPEAIYAVCGVLCVLATLGCAGPLLRMARRVTADERSPAPVGAAELRSS